MTLPTFLSAFILFSSGALAGGNGGSYSGPNMSGSSVPTQSDQSFTLRSVRDATKSCLADFAASVWEQAYRTPYRSSVEANANRAGAGASASGTSPNRLQINFAPNSCTYSLNLSVTGLLRFDDLSIRGDRCGHQPLEVSVTVQGEVVQLYLPGGLPYFKTLTSTGEAVYDSLGRVDDSKLEGVRVPVSLENTTSATSVRLVNAATEGPSKIAVSPTAYSNCLRARLK